MAERGDAVQREISGVQPHFAVEITVSNGLHTVVPTGELDLAAAPSFAAAIAGILDKELGDVVIDLRGLTFIDSCGLQALSGAHRDLLARGHGVRMIPGPKNVQRLFEIAGMIETLPFVE